MARLSPPDPALIPGELREFLDQVPRHAAFDILANSISTVRPFLQQGIAQYTSLELPARSRELVILTTATVAECAYEFVQHTPISEAAGVHAVIRAAIAALDFDHPSVCPYDRAVIRFVAHLVQQPTVPDEIFDDVRQHLSDREILEVLQIAGFYWSFGRVCTVLDIEVEEGHGTAVVEASKRIHAQ
jgi:alkylhydroperoxidase family enzyme